MRITVYTRPNCQPCKATKRKLDDLGAVYTLIDVTEDADAADTIKALGYKQAPVIVADEQHWAGFAPDRLTWAAGQQEQ